MEHWQTTTKHSTSWWRHQMETFFVLLALCAGNSPVTVEFPVQRPVTRRFDVFFDLCLNKRLSKQWRGWWFETPSRPFWRHCNVLITCIISTRYGRSGEHDDVRMMFTKRCRSDRMSTWKSWRCIPVNTYYWPSAIHIKVTSFRNSSYQQETKQGQCVNIRDIKYIIQKVIFFRSYVVGFDHGLPCRVKNMAQGTQ